MRKRAPTTTTKTRSKKRDYKDEYARYHSRGAHRVGHAMRLRARKKAQAMGLVRPHDGLELHHMNVDVMDARPENWAFLDKCTHRLVHGEDCGPGSVSRPIVVYGGPGSYLETGARAPRGHAVFASRLEHVLEHCRPEGVCPPGAQPPAHKDYKQKGRKARKRITASGGVRRHLSAPTKKRRRKM